MVEVRQEEVRCRPELHARLRERPGEDLESLDGRRPELLPDLEEEPDEPLPVVRQVQEQVFLCVFVDTSVPGTLPDRDRNGGRVGWTKAGHECNFRNSASPRYGSLSK